MICTETALSGVFLVDPEPVNDERGFFARVWCLETFAALGLGARWVQNSISFNRHKGTLRGMHYQAAPHAEVKLVRCTRGAIYDVSVDLRPGSPTFGQHVGVILSAENRRAIYIPQQCAHGFVTLEDASEVLYEISAQHSPESARGFRWDDPVFQIKWPEAVRIASDRDRRWPPFVMPNAGPR